MVADEMCALARARALTQMQSIRPGPESGKHDFVLLFFVCVSSCSCCALCAFVREHSRVVVCLSCGTRFGASRRRRRRGCGAALFTLALSQLAEMAGEWGWWCRMGAV